MSSILSQIVNGSAQARGVVSPEEAQMSAVAMAEHNHGISQDNQELNRLVDIANGLDNVAVVAGHVKTATRCELAFIENSVELALAGENIENKAGITYGLESSEGSTIAVEGIKDVVIKIWTAIKNLMKRIRERVVKFFKSRWGAVASLRKSLEKLKVRNDKMVGKTIDETKTNLGREIKALYIEGTIEKSESAIVTQCEVIKKDSDALFIKFTKAVNEAGKTISDSMDKFNASSKDASKDAIQNAIGAAVNLKGVVFTGTKGYTDSDKRFNEKQTVTRAPLLFNQAAFTLDVQPLKGDTTNRVKAEGYAKSRLMITSISEKVKDLNDDGTINTWSTSTIDDIVTAMLDGLESLERYEGSTEFKDIASVNKDIAKAGDSIAKDVSGEDGLDDDINDDSKGLRALATGYARWTSEGFTAYAQYILNVGNSMVTISNKCLSNYK